MPYLAYELSAEQRAKLLRSISPAFPDVIAHHCTYQFGVSDSHSIPESANLKVVGITTDFTRNVQCVVVSINGWIYRPDGKIYHVTVSLDKSKGAKPVMSNDAIAEHCWISLPSEIDLGLVQCKLFK